MALIKTGFENIVETGGNAANEHFLFKLYFIRLFLDTLWIKKCHNLHGGKYFCITVNIFRVPKI